MPTTPTTDVSTKVNGGFFGALSGLSPNSSPKRGNSNLTNGGASPSASTTFSDSSVSSSIVLHDRAWRRARVAATARDVFLFLLAFRILNALCVRTFFQPDEYFQSLEPAWRTAFGERSGAWITWVRRWHPCFRPVESVRLIAMADIAR